MFKVYVKTIYLFDQLVIFSMQFIVKSYIYLNIRYHLIFKNYNVIYYLKLIIIEILVEFIKNLCEKFVGVISQLNGLIFNNKTKYKSNKSYTNIIF